MTPRVVCPVMGAGQQARGTYAARATHADQSPGAGAGGLYRNKKGRPQPHVATGPGLRQRSPFERNATR